MSQTSDLIRTPSSLPAFPTAVPPPLIAAAGRAACFAWDEYFIAQLSNPRTRQAYGHAVRRFLAWIEPQGVTLENISPGMVGAYFTHHPGSPPTRKLHLAAIRGLFDLLVIRHVMILNPAASVRGQRYTVIEGKTPEITLAQAQALIQSIDAGSVLGLRDRAVIAVLIFTAARAGAVAKLRRKHFAFDGSQWVLHFDEKGGKVREIPSRLDLQKMILAYLKAAGLDDAPGDTPLFRTTYRKSGRLTANPLSGVDICRMVKRRLKHAGLPARLSLHSFRVFTITDLLLNGVALEEVQYLAGHSDPRVTRLYDRRQKRVAGNTVERISLQLEQIAE